LATSRFKRILVTAALPYANGLIHLGHLAGAYLPADIYVRYQRLKGRDVLFICGSDEHGVPITISALNEKTTPQAIIDRYHALNRESFEKFGMSFDNYSRTSLPLHHETSKEFFLDWYQKGLLKEKSETQLYCEYDKRFLADRYVQGKCPICGNPDARGDQCENCGSMLSPSELIEPRCSICGNPPVLKTTSNWYFPLGDFQKKLEEYIHSKTDWKENVLRYCEGWLKEGLDDRALTRDLDWGVKVPLPGYENKVIYVWFEALLGYISSTKEWAQRIGQPQKWKEYWQDEETKYIAFIGKDNVVFHCIIFPAMLMARRDYEPKTPYLLPDNVPANEFLNLEGKKLSKSRNWSIDLKDYLELFPPDALRYTLGVNLPETHDTDFYWKDFQARNNNELADILGNFVNRTLAFAGRYFENQVPNRSDLCSLDKGMIGQLKETPNKVGEAYEHYRFRDGIQETMNLARAANKYFNDSEPWKTRKENPTQCATTINICLQTVRSLAILMEPLLPFSSQKVWQMLNLQGTVQQAGWDSAAELRLATGHKLAKPEILFAKIEDSVIEEQTRKLGTAAEKVQEKTLNIQPTITIQDFQKIDLRVARVLQCENVEKSDKLLKLQIEIGFEKRQIIAGIAQHYKPEELVGKQIIVVANLEPVKIRGMESNGMLLAATGSNGELALLTVEREVESGSRVK